MQPEEYIAAPTFMGTKDSYVFRTSNKGTGYYLDYAAACAANTTVTAPGAAGAAIEDDDAALAAELQGLGLKPEQEEAVREMLRETPQQMAERAAAAFAEAGKLTRVGGAGAGAAYFT